MLTSTYKCILHRGIYPPVVTVYKGNSITLTCYGILNVKWKFSDAVREDAYLFGSTLHISSAKISHSGFLYCSGTSYSKKFTAAAEIFVGCKFIWLYCIENVYKNHFTNVYVILITESECDIAKYFTCRLIYFHEQANIFSRAG